MSDDQSQVFERIAAVVAALFHVRPQDISPATFSDDVDGWDSLSYTELLLRLEDEFSIEISPSKAWELKNLGELRDLIVDAGPR